MLKFKDFPIFHKKLIAITVAVRIYHKTTLNLYSR